MGQISILEIAPHLRGDLYLFAPVQLLAEVSALVDEGSALDDLRVVELRVRRVLGLVQRLVPREAGQRRALGCHLRHVQVPLLLEQL